jgi:hypothetical protein
VLRSRTRVMDDVDQFYTMELREASRDRAEVPQCETREISRIRGLDVSNVEVNTREIHAPLFKVGKYGMPSPIQCVCRIRPIMSNMEREMMSSLGESSTRNNCAVARS